MYKESNENLANFFDSVVQLSLFETTPNMQLIRFATVAERYEGEPIHLRKLVILGDTNLPMMKMVSITYSPNFEAGLYYYQVRFFDDLINTPLNGDSPVPCCTFQSPTFNNLETFKNRICDFFAET